MLVVLDRDPLGAEAVEVVDALDRALPSVLAEAGLEQTSAALAGDSATASFLVHQTEDDLVRIALAAMIANLVMLLVFLRAVYSSVLLLGATLLSLAATLGITTLVFETLVPGQGLTFYVPFATAVLLLAFGSDYNIFTVGHVWEAARTSPLRQAAIRALPPAIWAVTAAGAALAASFGLLALVPLLPFRQLAFAVTLGIVLDVAVVRTLLVPGLLSLLGPRATWPRGP
jgi:RND superfamily putative drug exporter